MDRDLAGHTCTDRLTDFGKMIGRTDTRTDTPKTASSQPPKLRDGGARLSKQTPLKTRLRPQRTPPARKSCTITRVQWGQLDQSTFLFELAAQARLAALLRCDAWN
jgi:hypothetical protein